MLFGSIYDFTFRSWFCFLYFMFFHNIQGRKVEVIELNQLKVGVLRWFSTWLETVSTCLERVSTCLETVSTCLETALLSQDNGHSTFCKWITAEDILLNLSWDINENISRPFGNSVWFGAIYVFRTKHEFHHCFFVFFWSLMTTRTN